MKTLCLGFFVLLVHTATCDPCRTFQPYPDVDERRPDNPYKADDPVNDMNLVQQWYGAAGMDLVKAAPPMERCGTMFPVWLKEATDTEATMCIKSDGQDCKATFTVQRKTCGTLNIYELKRTRLRNSGYCVDFVNADERPPVYPHKPEVEAGIIDIDRRSQLQFNCNFPETAAEFYTVQWFVNDRRIETHQSVRYADVRTNTVLTEGTLRTNGITKPGFQVKCGVQAHTVENGPGSDLQTSEEKYIGIKILDQEVTVMEGECKQVRVQLVAPFGCGSANNDCELGTELLDLDKPNQPCQGATVTRTTCGTNTFRKSTWDTPVTLDVCGAVATTYGSHRATRKLRLKTDFLFLLHEFWQDYEIGDITVHITRESSIIKGKRCSATNDPHMTTFNGKLYEHHIAGVFTLYKHLELPLEIQLETRSCGGTVKCNCGLAIRAGPTVYILDRCGLPEWTTGYKHIQQGENLLDVRFKGNNYRVTLPTGGLVEVSLNGRWLNVYFSPSVKDAEKTGGLCGKLTTQCAQELTLRNGQVATDAHANTCNKGRRYYRQFSENWRVEAGNNLFEDDVQGNWPTSELYCSCPERTNGVDFINKVVCSANKASEPCRQMPGFKVTLPRRLAAKRRKRSVEELSENLRYKREAEETKPEWSNGWTEAKAREQCKEMFDSSKSMEICRHVPFVNRNASEENCFLDIEALMSGDFMMTALDGVRTKCVHEVMMDPEMHNETSGKPSMLEMVMDAVICPNECNHKGTCNGGVCECEADLGGVDCSVDLTKPPMVTELHQNDGCVLGECNQTSVYGETFVDSDQLKCRVKQLKVFEDGSVEEGAVQEVAAELYSIGEVGCELPDIVPTDGGTKTHANGFRVAVSNTGEVYSEELDMLVLDPTCQRQLPGDQNMLKWERTGSDHCIAGGRCVADGQAKPDGTVCNVRDTQSGAGRQAGLQYWIFPFMSITCYLFYF